LERRGVIPASRGTRPATWGRDMCAMDRVASARPKGTGTIRVKGPGSSQTTYSARGAEHGSRIWPSCLRPGGSASAESITEISPTIVLMLRTPFNLGYVHSRANARAPVSNRQMTMSPLFTRFLALASPMALERKAILTTRTVASGCASEGAHP
jgi:hypothetical protein